MHEVFVAGILLGLRRTWGLCGCLRERRSGPLEHTLRGFLLPTELRQFQGMLLALGIAFAFSFAAGSRQAGKASIQSLSIDFTIVAERFIVVRVGWRLSFSTRRGLSRRS
jgi:hypothetical protein